jgi:translation initiation factor IF-3
VSLRIWDIPNAQTPVIPSSQFSFERTGTKAVRFCFCTQLEAAPISTENKRVRVNRQIRISPVRVIGADGEQMGILAVEEALAAAEQEGLDLVEVAPTARPPVVRIMDYGKYKYEEARKARQARKKQHQIQVKEVKFRPGIEAHDFEFKVRHAYKFLEEGDKVKVTMMFRGRQMAHPELGREVLMRVAEALQTIGKVESAPMMEARTMTMVLAPKK